MNVGKGAELTPSAQKSITWPPDVLTSLMESPIRRRWLAKERAGIEGIAKRQGRISASTSRVQTMEKSKYFKRELTELSRVNDESFKEQMDLSEAHVNQIRVVNWS